MAVCLGHGRITPPPERIGHVRGDSVPGRAVARRRACLDGRVARRRRVSLGPFALPTADERERQDAWLHSHLHSMSRACAAVILLSRMSRACGGNYVPPSSTHRSVTLYHPPPSMWTPPPWTLDFSESPTDPPTGGGWTLDFSESPTDPPGGGGWTLDLKRSESII